MAGAGSASRTLAWLGAAVLLSLAGCRTAPPNVIVGPGADAPWPQQRSALESLQRYGLEGRVAVAANGQGFSANLRYAQKPRAAQLKLDGPMGIGGMRIDLRDDEVAIQTSRGEQLDGGEARAELERRLGFELPLAELRWWLLGIPAPGEAALDADAGGQIRGFTQNGWRVNITARVASLGFSLPQRLTVERTETQGAKTRLKLAVDHWLP